MEIALIIIMNVCPGFKFISNDPPTDRDKRVINASAKTCSEKYQSCLKTLIKKGSDMYYAECQ